MIVIIMHDELQAFSQEQLEINSRPHDRTLPRGETVRGKIDYKRWRCPSIYLDNPSLGGER
jgi:hypothetical protein